MIKLLRGLFSPTITSPTNCLSFGSKQSRNHKHTVLIQRCIHVTRKKYFWEPDRKGGIEFAREDKISDKEHVKRGAKMLIPETKKWLWEMKEYFAQDNMRSTAPIEGVTDKYFEFGGPESLNKWVATSDIDWNQGYSTAELSISPVGSGIFAGNLSTRTPKTGKIHQSGYVNLRYVPPLESFSRDPTYVFVAYSHMVLRVRGDGRTYMVNLHPHNMFDVSYFNMYSYVLHTRGGPYWQETKLPFSKFFMHYKGRIQDQQYPIDLGEIKSFSITLMDKNDGPFRLEIDYVGCVRDDNHYEEFAYESYYVPRWHGKN